MIVNVKQLCDLISMALIVVIDEDDKTTTNPNPEGQFHWYSPATTEIGRILGVDCSCEDAELINQHLAAIRLGMKLNTKKEERI